MREKNLFDRIYLKTHPKQNKVEVLLDIDKRSKTSKNIPSLCPSYISVFRGGMLQIGQIVIPISQKYLGRWGRNENVHP